MPIEFQLGDVVHRISDGQKMFVHGGDKTGRDRFYEEMVPVADKLYDVHLEELKKEGLI